MTSIFWDCKVVIVLDYLEEGRTINGAYYAELKWLRQDLVKKRRGQLNRGVLFLQDTAPAQSSQVAMAKLSFEVLSYSPYSPNLALCTSICFQI